tara:strand:- start:1860 stop:2006 length:147 start_codon:yes stop_codon:yes gene_type:complete
MSKSQVEITTTQSLEKLRVLLAKGLITEEEFNSAEELIIKSDMEIPET